MKIETHLGAEVRVEVDEFYAAQAANARARGDDFFFLLHLEEKLAGAVRFCIEGGIPMLRSMMIAEESRGQGLGKCLLSAFAEFLDEEKIHGVICLPFAHLETFYGSKGFRRIETPEIPAFLVSRMAEYNFKPKKVICMRRP